MSPTSVYLLETLATLVLVCLVAVAVLFGARRLGVGAPSGPLELLGRLPLDARRSVYVVRIGPQALILGASEAGLIKLSEIPYRDVPVTRATPTQPFATVLGRAFGRSPEPPASAASRSPSPSVPPEVAS